MTGIENEKAVDSLITEAFNKQSMIEFDNNICHLFKSVFYSFSQDAISMEKTNQHPGIVSHFLKNWKDSIGLSSISKTLPAIITGTEAVNLFFYLTNIINGHPRKSLNAIISLDNGRFFVVFPFQLYFKVELHITESFWQNVHPNSRLKSDSKSVHCFFVFDVISHYLTNKLILTKLVLLKRYYRALYFIQICIFRKLKKI